MLEWMLTRNLEHVTLTKHITTFYYNFTLCVICTWVMENSNKLQFSLFHIDEIKCH